MGIVQLVYFTDLKETLKIYYHTLVVPAPSRECNGEQHVLGGDKLPAGLGMGNLLLWQ